MLFYPIDERRPSRDIDALSTRKRQDSGVPLDDAEVPSMMDAAEQNLMPLRRIKPALPQKVWRFADDDIPLWFARYGANYFPNFGAAQTTGFRLNLSCNTANVHIATS
jgi:hypothetical protein